HRCIDCQYRRAFRCAVTLQNAQAEFFHPELTHFFIKLFCARDHVAYLMKIVRMGKFCIVTEKGAGAENYAATPVVNDLRNDAIVQRRWIKKKWRSADDRQYCTGSETECMK